MTALVLAARRYLGVPFVHRGRRPPKKLDCVGLVLFAYRDCGVVLEDFRLYGREPDITRWKAAMERNLGPPVRSPLQAGDVVAMRTLANPHHLAIVFDHAEGLGLIHASGEHGRVVEHGLDATYLRRITHIYRRPV
jgi:cell wall-associated NlpC family hydrolase